MHRHLLFYFSNLQLFLVLNSYRMLLLDVLKVVEILVIISI